MSEHAVVIALGAAGLAALAAAMWNRESGQRLRRSALAAMPVIGPIVAKAQAALLLGTLGRLLRHGVSLVPAVELVAGLASHPRQREALSRACERLREGAQPSRAFQDCGLPEPALAYIAIGEEVNRLDDMLLHVAGTFEGEIERDSSRALTLLGPAITIVLGVVVGGLVLTVMQAILSINELAVR
jgi:general secretion pathway protein F